MGVRLIAEVLDHAPAELTPTERLVLLVVAYSARDDTRQAWPGMDVLTRRTGLTASGVKQALQRMAGKGVDLRVPLATGVAGQPVYAARGRRCVYMVPALDPESYPQGYPQRRLPPATKPQRRLSTATNPEKGGWHQPERWLAPALMVAPASPPESHGSQEPSSPRETTVDRLLSEAGLTPEEGRNLIEKVKRDKNPRSLSGYLSALQRSGDLAEMVRQTRAETGRLAWSNERAAFLRGLAKQPACEHGISGGDIAKPSGVHIGWRACPVCRRHAERSKVATSGNG